MNKEEMILAVIKRYRENLRKLENRDEINKAYRHARIWSHTMTESGVITEDDRTRCNEAFKKMRWNRLNKIEEA